MSLSRREFLKAGAVGGGLVLGFSLTGCSDQPLPHASNTDLQPNAFLQVTPEGEVILQLHKVEMGQGTMMGMATLVAEELGMEPADIRVEHAQFHPDFRDPEMHMMMTGGSSSMRNSFDTVRLAAATVREIFLTAAARQWRLSEAELQLAGGVVSARAGEQSATLGELLGHAKNVKVPSEATPKRAAEYRYIGQPGIRVDATEKVTGQAVYGLDVLPSEIPVAVMLRCPQPGGRALSYTSGNAHSIPGFLDIVPVNGGVAVLGEGYWPARKAADEVKVQWELGPLTKDFNDSSLRAHQRALLEEEGREVVSEGEQKAAVGETFRAEYRVPYQSHCPMEPPNAVADVRSGQVEIWTGTQVPDTVIGIVAAALDRPREQIVVHNHLLGGGFGRRLVPDYVVEAALLSAKIKGPVKLMWSREDDIQHDFYRPSAMVRMEATIQGERVTSLQSKVVCSSLLGNLMPMYSQAVMPEWLPPGIPRALGGMAKYADSSATEGIGDTDYHFPFLKVDWVRDETPVPIGFWRSVGHSQNAFFIESFIDELAHETGADAVQFRLDHLPADSRRRRALSLAAEKAAWGKVPKGQFQGVAVHESFHTAVAQVATVSVEKGVIRVHKVVCVVDCGLAVNPDIVRSQMESGIVFALTAALKGEITFAEGRVQQSNFHDFEMLRIHETPDIEVHIVPSEESPTGVGEPGVPPLAPAVANAVFAATGQRLRELPLRLS